MKTLPRYILREFLTPLVYCLAGFVSIYVLFELFGSFSRMIEAKLPVTTAIVYFAGYLAPYFHYLVPAALMLATLYTMWSMCRHSEIIAMRASGVSFGTIVRPLLLVATVMALAVVFVNEWFVPRYANWATQLKGERFDLEKIVQADNIVYCNVSEGRTWNVDEVRSADGSSLAGVHITVDRPGGARLETITAARADYLDGEWWLSEVKVQHHDHSGREIATKTPELDALPLRCYDDFSERPDDFMMQNRPWKYLSVRDRFRYLRLHPELTPEKRSACVYDTWAQILAPWACLIITLFAIPAGISSGRQSVFKGILGALGLYFAFYGVTVGCYVLANCTKAPPILMAVLPAVIFLALGIRSFLKQR